MFVPLHRRRAPAAGCKPVRAARAGAVLAAVLAAIMTGLVGSILDRNKHADSGDYILLGLVIAVTAVGVGVALAKAIGRQGRL